MSTPPQGPYQPDPNWPGQPPHGQQNQFGEHDQPPNPPQPGAGQSTGGFPQQPASGPSRPSSEVIYNPDAYYADSEDDDDPADVSRDASQQSSESSAEPSSAAPTPGDPSSPDADAPGATSEQQSVYPGPVPTDPGSGARQYPDQTPLAYGDQPTGYQASPPSHPDSVPQYSDSHTAVYPGPPTGSQAAPYPGPQTGTQAVSYPPGPPWSAPAQTTAKKSKKGLWIGLGAAALVGVLIAGYFLFFTGFQGVRNDEGDIANAKSFLSKTESTWKGSLPSDGINVPDKTGCYYVMKDDNTIDEQIACGPTRRASTGTGEVWDLYPFGVSGSGDKQEAGDLGDVALSQTLPSGSYLANTDGDGPSDDGSGLEEPPLPKAPENGLWTSADFEVDESNAGEERITGTDEVKLIGPGAQVVVTSVVEYAAATVDGQLHGPAEDQQFYLVTLTGDPGPVASEKAVNTLAIDIDGTEVSLPDSPASMGEQSYLVSIAKDGDNRLVLDTDGYDQSIDLADGTRTESPTTDLYYTDNPVPKVELNADLPFGSQATSPTDSIALQATATTAQLIGYDEFDGWADEGSIWLLIDGDQSADIHYPQLGPAAYTSYKLDCVAGSTISTGTIEYCGNTEQGKFQILAQVPADARDFSLSVNMSLTASGEGVPDVPVTFPAAPLEVSFP